MVKVIKRDKVSYFSQTGKMSKVLTPVVSNKLRIYYVPPKLVKKKIIQKYNDSIIQDRILKYVQVTHR